MTFYNRSHPKRVLYEADALQRARDKYDCNCKGVPCPEVRAHLDGYREGFAKAIEEAAKITEKWQGRMSDHVAWLIRKLLEE